MKRLLFILIAVMLILQACIETDYTGKTSITGFGWVGIILLGLLIAFLLWGAILNAKNKKSGIASNAEVTERMKILKIKEAGFSTILKSGIPNLDCGSRIVINTFDDNLIIFDNKDVTSHFFINKTDIVDIRFEEKGNRSVGKAATGAIVGGVLTGGIGVIAGAALGAKKKNTSELFIDYTHKERIFTMRLNTGKNTEPVYNRIIKLFA